MSSSLLFNHKPSAGYNSSTTSSYGNSVTDESRLAQSTRTGNVVRVTQQLDFVNTTQTDGTRMKMLVGNGKLYFAHPRIGLFNNLAILTSDMIPKVHYVGFGMHTSQDDVPSTFSLGTKGEFPVQITGHCGGKKCLAGQQVYAIVFPDREYQVFKHLYHPTVINVQGQAIIPLVFFGDASSLNEIFRTVVTLAIENSYDKSITNGSHAVYGDQAARLSKDDVNKAKNVLDVDLATDIDTVRNKFGPVGAAGYARRQFYNGQHSDKYEEAKHLEIQTAQRNGSARAISAHGFFFRDSFADIDARIASKRGNFYSHEDGGALAGFTKAMGDTHRQLFAQLRAFAIGDVNKIDGSNPPFEAHLGKPSVKHGEINYLMSIMNAMQMYVYPIGISKTGGQAGQLMQVIAV